jgi:uncharacterized protein YbjT (DUF2867 family)
MSKIFIVGVTGGVGSRLAPKLLKSGHSVSGLYRDKKKESSSKELGIKPLFGDLMDMSVDDFIEITKDHDVIVFSAGAAGSGLDRTTAIDYETPVKLLKAAKANGISRFYLISAFMDSIRDKPRNDNFEHYMKMKRQADNAVVASKLDWVILRPGTLVSEEGSGLVNLERAISYGNVARGNVASVLAALINEPSIKKEIFELVDGDIPVNEAIKAIKR